MLRYWRVLGLALVVMAVGAVQLYGVFSNAGYEPKQPIKYSHVLHAGVMKMECLYCHFTAEESAHAGVPPVDVCMGCHNIVQTQSPEIQKLAEYYNNGEPVPWVRIHRTPDHAYFSHKWHVKAGVSCQTCHGPIENMPVVKQWQKLEMGACMECHRQDTYVENVNHTPTWHAPELTEEQITAAKADMRGQYAALADVDGQVEAVGADAPESGASEKDPEWTSVHLEYSKYYADLDPAEGMAMLKMLEEYKNDITMHGWGAQLRNHNASVECNICHN